MRVIQDDDNGDHDDMIERWLQITCDECGETDFSTDPNMAILEFMLSVRDHFRKFGNKHLCQACAKAAGRPWKTRADLLMDSRR